MNEALRKGWCPSLMKPMATGDGLLVRVKPPAGRLPASSAEGLAEAAARHGNGFIDLTNRGNLQIRGLSEADVEGFAETIIGLGLAVPGREAEGARTVLVDPLGPDDPRAAVDSHALGLAIEAMIVATPELHKLPGKFGFVADAGVLLPALGLGADIGFYADGDGWRIRLGGCGGSAWVEDDAACDAAYRLAAAFVAIPGGPLRRMREANAKDMFDAAGLAYEDTFRALETNPAPIGFCCHDHSSLGAFVLAGPFGAIASHTLSSLARLAERFGDATLRMTSWKALVLPAIEQGDAERIAEWAGELGMIVDAGDPRLRISACPGRPACPSASVDARGDATRLAALDISGIGDIHVSGCAKGCAHPRTSPVTLVGNDGRYDLVRDGRADAEPDIPGLGFAEAAGWLQREGAR